MNKTVFERRSTGVSACQQLALVANLMALRLDPDEPDDAALLQMLERALYRIRKEGSHEEPGSNMAIQAGNDRDRSVLLRGDDGLDLREETQ